MNLNSHILKEHGGETYSVEFSKNDELEKLTKINFFKVTASKALDELIKKFG